MYFVSSVHDKQGFIHLPAGRVAGANTSKVGIVDSMGIAS
jgi:hypothetical protein